MLVRPIRAAGVFNPSDFMQRILLAILLLFPASIHAQPTRGNTLEVSTIDELRTMPVSSNMPNRTVEVRAYATLGDQGGGRFVYDSSSSATDNGTSVIAPNSGSGRWMRQYGSVYDSRWFGTTTNQHFAIGGNTNVPLPLSVYGNADMGFSVSGGAGANTRFIGGFDRDMWIQIIPGITNSQRGYFAWMNPNGTYTPLEYSWLMGKNSNSPNQFILYDANFGTHRLWATQGGATEIAASRTNAVKINSSPSGDANAGTGGLEIYSGTASPSIRHYFNNDIALHLAPNGTERYFALSQSGIGTWLMGVTAQDALGFWDQNLGNPYMVLATGGYLGIGDNLRNPTNQFVVQNVGSVWTAEFSDQALDSSPSFIDADGNWVIGTTAAAVRKFNLVTDNGVDQAFRFTHAGVGSWDMGIRVGDAFSIWDQGISTPYLDIDTGGNIGMGVIDAEADLVVAKSYATPAGGINPTNTVAVFANNNTANGHAGISILARSSGESIINLGSESSETTAQLIYGHSAASPFFGTISGVIGGTDVFRFKGSLSSFEGGLSISDADGTGPSWRSGTGSPEGLVIGNVGDFWSRTDGGTATTLYVKESGTGNTGWVAIGPGGGGGGGTVGTIINSGGPEASIAGGIPYMDDTTGTNALPSNVTIVGKTNLLAATLTATNWVRFPFTTLTYTGGTNVLVDLSAGSVFGLTLTNTAFIIPTNVPSLSQTLYIHLLQDGVGGRTVTWEANTKWPSGAAPVISAAANAYDLVTLTRSFKTSTNLAATIAQDFQ